VLFRRVQRIHLSTSSGDVALERSAYGIMCKLADEGPQGLGTLVATFGLDPSTITRQVQALEEIELAFRMTDPSDICYPLRGVAALASCSPQRPSATIASRKASPRSVSA
jgi:DNA-binding MarR family transcriptional regulator